MVAGLYASALYARAARGLAELHRAAGDAARRRNGRRGRRRPRPPSTAGCGSRDVASTACTFPITSPPGWKPPDDADIFALGGNALAALYGIADGPRAARLLDVAEERRREHGLSTIGGVLLPPYPAGFFQHPILREPFTYQNGGQWDWWAGRFVLAEFERGHAVAGDGAPARAGRARRRRRRAARVEHPRRPGAGEPAVRGQRGRAGGRRAAGTLRPRSRAERPRPPRPPRRTLRRGARARAGDGDDASPTARRYDARARILALSFESSAPGTGRLEILLPPGATPAALRVDGRRARAAGGADGGRGPLRGGEDGLEAARARAGAALIGLAAAALAAALPFGAGERITMRVTYARLTAGHATMSVEAADARTAAPSCASSRR